MLSFDFGWAGEWYTVTLTMEWLIGIGIALWAIIGVIIARLSIPNEYTSEEFEWAVWMGVCWPIIIVAILVLVPIALLCVPLQYILTAGKKSRY
jgi:uncharacterized protein with PQ loop repeat